MFNKTANVFFDKSQSQSYDERNKHFAPISHNLHFLIQLVLKDLPQDANVLCVGVGTGVEITALAQAFPGWRFDGIDPSDSMLDACKKLLEDKGLANQCHLFHGYLSEFETTKKYDAVLCLLVMHFIKDLAERTKMFQDMAAHLKSDGYLINAEISYDTASAEYPVIFEKWKTMQGLSGATQEALDNLHKTLEDNLLILPPFATEKLMQDADLPMPIQFFQALLIHAWYVQKK